MPVSVGQMVCSSLPPHAWYTDAVHRTAELLNSLPSADDVGSITDVDSPMSDAPPPQTPHVVPKDPIELRLEARENHKYLLAKTFFDCREFDRCAAIFLPNTLPKGSIYTASPSTAKTKSKGKGKLGTPTKAKSTSAGESTQGLSQKALFLALYAKYIAGEKRMNEDSKMILGPEDGGVTTNQELPGICTILEEWFVNLPTSGRKAQGWLEYLYGVVLVKSKNEKLAMDFFIRSVHQYTYNWAAWEELISLLGTTEEVRFSFALQWRLLTCPSWPGLLPACLRT
jgi:anaphase-promoting complex subunit 8